MEEVINKIETSIAHFHIENDILFITLKENACIDVEQVKEAIKARKEIQENKPMLTLNDVRNLYDISREARAFAANNASLLKLNTAMAILTSSLATKLFANFFIKFNKPGTPTKIFNKKEDALEWLNALKK